MAHEKARRGNAAGFFVSMRTAHQAVISIMI